AGAMPASSKPSRRASVLRAAARAALSSATEASESMKVCSCSVIYRRARFRASGLMGRRQEDVPRLVDSTILRTSYAACVLQFSPLPAADFRDLAVIPLFERCVPRVA